MAALGMEVEQEDWRVGRSLLHRIQYMFDTHYATDVVFKVGPSGTQMHAHRVFLIAGSPVFDAMLSRWKATGDDEQEFTVDDVEPDVFLEMLRYLTYDEVNITGENVLNLLYVAHKYLISGLIDKCGTYLQDNLNVTNVCVVLDHAIRYEAADLKRNCVDLMTQSAKAVLESEEFLKLSSSALETFLDSDVMKVDSETDVYRACLRWADEKCREEKREVTDANRRAVLGLLFWKIRFPIMSVAEFANVTRSSTFLTPAEKIAVFEYIGLKQQADTKKPRLIASVGSFCPFNCKDRNFIKNLVVKRFKMTTSGFECNQSSQNAVDLETDKDVEIIGFGIYGDCYNTTNQPVVQVQVLDENQRVLTDTGDVTLRSCPEESSSSDPVKIVLPTPLHIEANARYTIMMTTVRHFTSFYGNNGIQQVKKCDCTFTFHRTKSHGMVRNNSSNVNQGQIPEIIFRV